RHRLQGLALLDHVQSPRRRYVMCAEAVATCQDEHMSRTALQFQSAALDAALAWSPGGISDALIRQAGIHHSLGADDLAATDVLESRRWIARIPEEFQAERQRAEANAVEGEILVREKPEQAARSLGQSLVYFQGTAPVRVPA